MLPLEEEEIEEIVNQLRSIGLNTYEATAYLNLALHEPLPATKLADYSDIPRSKIYETLNSLEAKGLVIKKMGRPKIYTALPPTQAYQHLVETTLKQLDKVKPIFKALEEKYDKQKMGEEVAWILEGPDKIKQTLEIFLQNTQKEIIGICNPEHLPISNTPQLRRTLTKLSEKGVKIRIGTKITPENLSTTIEAKKKFEPVDTRFYHTDMGAHIAHLVSDVREALILSKTRGNRVTYDIGVWIKSEGMSREYHRWITSNLDKSITLEERQAQMRIGKEFDEIRWGSSTI